jgi:hypothetical protein
MFALDGQTFSIKNLLVNFGREFKSQDMSGQSSSTGDADQGEKAATLDVSGLIAFRDLDQLVLLESMSSAKDENGDRKIYRVVNELATAFKIRQVKFVGKFSSVQQENPLAWRVAFTLRENNSVAEQKEMRNKENTKPEQSENTRLQQALDTAEEAIK